jgi:CubicO group peptidase (beta-lactamase class C family)
MDDSYHHEIAEKLDGKLDRMGAVYYTRDSVSGEWRPGWEPGDPPQVPFVRASGGMISTAMDYAIFCQMFLNGGEYGDVRIVSEETVETMTAPFVLAGGGVRTSYGYGWRVSEDGSFSHGGSDGTSAVVDPNHNLIALVFTQNPRGRNPSRKFLELVRSSIMN